MTARRFEAGTPPPRLPTDAALYLDFDGTLAHIAPSPDRVVIHELLPRLLTALRERQGGAVAVVTGRRLADVDELLAPAVLPGAGLHGAELRLASGAAEKPRRLREIATLVRALRQRFGDDPRVLIEDKGAAAALHFRHAPERGAECLGAMRELIEGTRLEAMSGKCVVEARVKGADKGAALRTLGTHAPFAGRMPVFVGDDTTDEDGFAAAAGMGGYGVKVGDGESVAPYRCAGVDDVHTWLRDSLYDSK